MASPGTAKIRVFLSHDSLDRTRVYSVRDRLTNEGFDVWIDDANIQPGQKWEAEIQRALSSSDVVLVCLSHRAVANSRYLPREIELARASGRHLIPIRLEECRIPDSLSDLHTFNVYQSDNWQRLIDELTKIAPRETLAPEVFEWYIRNLSRLCSEVDIPSRVSAVTTELYELRDRIVRDLRDRFYEKEAKEFAGIVPDRVYGNQQAVTKYMASASLAYLQRLFSVPQQAGSIGNREGAPDVTALLSRVVAVLNRYQLEGRRREEDGEIVLTGRGPSGLPDWAGLTAGITVRIRPRSGATEVRQTDARWFNKILAAFVGLFLTALGIGWILIGTAAWGARKQYKLGQDLTDVIDWFYAAQSGHSVNR